MSDSKEIKEEVESTFFEAFLSALKKWLSGLIFAGLCWFMYMSLCVWHLPSLYDAFERSGFIKKQNSQFARYLVMDFPDYIDGFFKRQDETIARLKKQVEKLNKESAELIDQIQKLERKIERLDSKKNYKTGQFYQIPQKK